MQKLSVITLILLPGMDGTGDLFEQLVQALPSTIKAVIVSYPTSKTMSYAELTAYAKTHLPEDSPYILLGESFSGPVAIALAAQATSQLKGLLLSCTFASNPRPKLSKLSFIVPALPFNQWLLPVVTKLLMGNFENQAVRQQLASALVKVPPAIMRARLDAVINVDYAQLLQNIQAPILYLQGQHDYLVPSSAAILIQKFAKNVEVISLNAPHLLLQIATQEAAEIVRQFVAKNHA